MQFNDWEEEELIAVLQACQKNPLHFSFILWFVCASNFNGIYLLDLTFDKNGL